MPTKIVVIDQVTHFQDIRRLVVDFPEVSEDILFVTVLLHPTSSVPHSLESHGI